MERFYKIKLNIYCIFMDWESAISDFVTYLRLEKSLSDNSIEAYRHDVMKLYQYLIATDQSEITPEKITIEHLHEFLYSRPSTAFLLYVVVICCVLQALCTRRKP